MTSAHVNSKPLLDLYGDLHHFSLAVDLTLAWNDGFMD